MKRAIYIASLSVVTLSLVGCDDNPDTLVIVRGRDAASGDANGDAASDSALEDGNADAEAGAGCVPKGSPGNELGIGAYCEDGDDCAREGEFRVCTRDFAAPEGAWFCTTLCGSDAQCGTGAVCGAEGACVPLACRAAPDGGVDAAPDGADAAPEAETD
jgi:hypothetical protein